MVSPNRTTERAYVALSFTVRGRLRHIELRARWVIGIAVLMIAVAACSLGAGSYVLFHDELLASLITRQADMQYAYEDRIAALRVGLDRETSRNLMDRHTIDTVIQDLNVRSSRLESRADTLDKLVADGITAVAQTRTHEMQHASVRDNGAPSSAADDLEPDISPRAAPRIGATMRSRSRADQGSETLSTHLAQIEDRQMSTLSRLRDPVLRATHRVAAALAETGLRARLAASMPADIGGPYVPMDAADTNSFDGQAALLRTTLEEQDRLASLADHIPLRDPLDGPIEVSSTFGARLDPFLGRPAMHTGIDLRQTDGDAVHATAAGVITAAGLSNGYGNMVEIDHGHGLVTRYAHLSAIDVVVHQRVETGAVVGRVGSTGRATGPHLHYETRIDGEPVDPWRFLKAGAGLFKG